MIARTLTALLAGATVLTGCADGTTDDAQARQSAGIHSLAQELLMRPGVTCAQGLVDPQGLPSAPDGSLRLTLTTDSLPPPEQEQLLRDAAEQVWASDLAVSSLFLEVRNGPEQLPTSIGDVLGTGVSFAAADDLEEAFGPRPSRPSPLPTLEDPGNPDC